MWDICIFVYFISETLLGYLYICILYEWDTTGISAYLYPLLIEHYWNICICVSSMSGTLLKYLYICILYELNNTGISVYVYPLWVEHYWGYLYICILYEWNTTGISLYVDPLWVEHILGYLFICILYEWNTTGISVDLYPLWEEHYWDICIFVSSMSGTLLGYLYICILYEWNTTEHWTCIYKLIRLDTKGPAINISCIRWKLTCLVLEPREFHWTFHLYSSVYHLIRTLYRYSGTKLYHETSELNKCNFLFSWNRV